MRMPKRLPGFLMSLLLTLPAQADDGNTYSREKVTAIIAAARKIVTEQGVEELVQLPIGETQQWVSIRGRNRENPVLLMIHGGPASPEMPSSWYFQSGWEDYFTVVQWDQRGSGKTYNANDPKLIQPTLSVARITEDAGEVVQQVRAKFGKQKIFVLGHSWGSLVGLSLAHQHPDWLYAYIGMGQVINGNEGERVGYEDTLKIAEATHNVKALADLKSIAPYPNPDGSLPLDKINMERNWSVAFGGLAWRRENLDFYYDLTRLSPDYSEADRAAIDKGSALSLGPRCCRNSPSSTSRMSLTGSAPSSSLRVGTTSPRHPRWRQSGWTASTRPPRR